MPEPIPLSTARRQRRGGGAEPPEDSAPAPRECPIIALGHRGGTFFFLDLRGQERSLSARQLGQRLDLSSLFHGNTEWLLQEFPKKQVVKETVAGESVVESERVVGFQTAQAGEYLMRACSRAGIYGDRITIRRHGIWRDADGSPLVHCGDVLICRDSERPPGLRVGNTVFGADEATPRPVTPCGPGIARQLQEGLKNLWLWRQPGGELVAIGLIGAGYLGAALGWRPNGFILGGPGSGKSKLLQVLHAAAPLGFYSNDTTKEGLSQGVNGKALPMFIDEASDRVDQRGAQVLMDLVLAATGDDGAKARRGTSDGRGRSVEVLGVITMASVAPPDMQSQHIARFTMMELQVPEAGEDHKAEMAALVALARDNGPALWGRALAAWPRWEATLAAFRAALGRAGCAAREMDQVGALLAGWWVLTEDGVPDARQALGGVVAITSYARRADEVSDADGSRQAVQHLLSCRVQRNHTTDLVPVAELMERAFRAKNEFEGEFQECSKHLARHGMRVVRADQRQDRQGRPVPRMGEKGGVWFSNVAKPLADLFRGTAWEGTRWRFALLGLETARRSAGTIRVGSVAAPGVWVGEMDLLGYRADGEEDEPDPPGWLDG